MHCCVYVCSRSCDNNSFKTSRYDAFMTSVYYRESRFGKNYEQKYGTVTRAIYHAISYIVIFHNRYNKLSTRAAKFAMAANQIVSWNHKEIPGQAGHVFLLNSLANIGRTHKIRYPHDCLCLAYTKKNPRGFKRSITLFRFRLIH